MWYLKFLTFLAIMVQLSSTGGLITHSTYLLTCVYVLAILSRYLMAHNFWSFMLNSRVSDWTVKICIDPYIVLVALNKWILMKYGLANNKARNYIIVGTLTNSPIKGILRALMRDHCATPRQFSYGRNQNRISFSCHTRFPFFH